MADYPSQYTSIHNPAFQYSSGITSLGVHVVYYHYAPSPYSQVHFTVRMCIKAGTYLTETPLTVPAQYHVLIHIILITSLRVHELAITKSR